MNEDKFNRKHKKLLSKERPPFEKGGLRSLKGGLIGKFRRRVTEEHF